MDKLAVCGPSKFSSENETQACIHIGKELGKFSKSHDIFCATGGSAGTPTIIIEEARKQNPNLHIEAYTPCQDPVEWDSFLPTGLVPQRALFNKINYLQSNERIETRALQRIPLFLDKSKAAIFYLNKQSGNTFVELFATNGLKIPSFVLTLEDTIKEAISTILPSSKKMRLYSDPERLSYDLINTLR